MAVPVLAANERLIDFHDAHEAHKFRIRQASPQPVRDVPRGSVGAGADHPVNLQGAHPLLGLEHQIEHLEPRQQRVIGVLKDGPDVERKAVPGLGALQACFRLAQPVKRARLEGVNLLVSALRADRAIRPAAHRQIGLGGGFIREQALEILEGFGGVRGGVCHA